MKALFAILFSCYTLGLFGLVCVLVASLAEGDKKFIIQYMPFKPKNNITLLIGAVLLISVWPVFILKPIYSWMKAPC